MLKFGWRSLFLWLAKLAVQCDEDSNENAGEAETGREISLLSEVERG